MPTLFRRSNGIYYVVFEGSDGKRKWKSTGENHKREALRALSELEKRLNENRKRVLLSDFIQDFLSYARGVYRPGTVGIYLKSLESFRKGISNLPLKAISERHIDFFKKERLLEIKPVTVNIELRTLRSAFYFAVRWKALTENPFKNVSLCRVEEKSPPFVTMAEFHLLVCSIKQQWLRDLVVVAGLTGMRRGELVNLQWTDVDMNRGLIQVQPRGRFVTKSGKRRSVPMNATVMDVLRRRMLDRQESCAYVFSKQEAKIHDHLVSRKFKSYVKTLGLSDDIHFHCLRHSFASWLVQDGVSLYEVQKLLGHSSIHVTEIYSHLVPEQLRRTVDRLQVELN